MKGKYINNSGNVFRILNCFFKVALSSVVFCYSQTSMATCEMASGAFQLRWSINIGNVIVQRDTPVGSVIYDQQLNSSQIGNQILECTADYQVQSYNMLRGTAVTGIEGVYSTNINGVGVKVTSNAGLIFASPPTTWLWNRPWVLGGPFRIRLYKTGSISGGALSTETLKDQGWDNYVLDATEWKSGVVPTPSQHNGFYVEKTALNAAFGQDGRHLQSVTFRVVGDADRFMYVMAEYGLCTRWLGSKVTCHTIVLELP